MNLGYDFRITDEEYQATKESLPFRATHFDIMWAIYQRRQMLFWSTGDLNFGRFNYMQMSELLRKEGDPEEAVKYLVMALWCGLNDIVESSEDPEIAIKAIESHEVITMNPYHLKFLCKYEDWVSYGHSWCYTIPISGPKLDLDTFFDMLVATVEYGKAKFTAEEINYEYPERKDPIIEQYERYKKVMGTDFMYTLDEFKHIKIYDKPMYEELKEKYKSYKKRR